MYLNGKVTNQYKKVMEKHFDKGQIHENNERASVRDWKQNEKLENKSETILQANRSLNG